MDIKKVLAIDFGASSGRAMIGYLDENGIHYEEIHRFSNDPVSINGILYWDVLRLYHEILQSLVKAKSHGEISSMAVDTWGVDFGLIDYAGNLLGNPIHYRDNRTKGMFEKVFQMIDPEELFHTTGNQLMEINTLFQVMSLVEKRDLHFAEADRLLMMPDLFHYFLTGIKVGEKSMVSTTQMFHIEKQQWAVDLMKKVGINTELFPDIVPSGTILGEIKESISKSLSIKSIPVIAVAGHDTQSAIVSVPTKEEDFIFLSCGTWSLLGTELNKPILNQKAMDLQITNEVGYGGKITFLKNLVGLWIVQECRRQWIREGKEYSFSQLEDLAQDAKPFQAFINPDNPIFAEPGNMPEQIVSYCRITKQKPPEGIGAIVRCIYESLAFNYRKALEEIKECTGKEYDSIHMIGGGIQSRFLCQGTASACHMLVLAGPVEATILGNITVQLITLGEIESLSEARKQVAAAENIINYQPLHEEKWDEAYKKFKEILC